MRQNVKSDAVNPALPYLVNYNSHRRGKINNEWAYYLSCTSAMTSSILLVRWLQKRSPTLILLGIFFASCTYVLLSASECLSNDWNPFYNTIEILGK